MGTDYSAALGLDVKGHMYMSAAKCQQSCPSLIKYATELGREAIVSELSKRITFVFTKTNI